MKKSYLWAIIPFIIALLFYTNVALHPDWIGPDGTLHEEFGSKVLGGLFFMISVISTIILIIRAIYLKHK